MSEPRAPTENRLAFLRSRFLLVALGCVVLFSVGYWALLSSFLAEKKRRSIEFTPGTSAGADYVRVRVSVLSVDPVKDALSLRVQFLPRGRFTADRRTPTSEMRVRYNSFHGTTEQRFKRGQRMSSIEAHVHIFQGDIADYPMDSYRSNFAVELDERVGTEWKPVPLRLRFVRVLHGLRPLATLAKRSIDGSAALRIHIERAAGTKFFAFIVMGIMAVLTLLTMTVSWHVVFRGRKPEFSGFSWMGAMLFAFPAIRNALPGQPPMGSFIDYLVFFWAEGLVAVALLAAVSAWLARPSSSK